MTQKKLEDYIELLLKWNAKINLISKSTENEIWDRHIEDSIQLNEYLEPNSTIIDFGSGGGLPAIPLAIFGHNVTMVESDLRKATFLRETNRKLELGAKIENKRAEKLNLNLTNGDSELIITARAFADLEKILEIGHSFLANHQITNYKFLLLKGENVSRETLQASKKWQFDLEEFSSKTNKNSKILLINNLKLQGA